MSDPIEEARERANQAIPPETMEARLRLEKEVEALKRRQDAGEELVKSHQERHAERLASDNILDLAAGIKEAMPILERMANHTAEFKKKFDVWLAEAPPTLCDEHECELPIDMDKSFGMSIQVNRLKLAYLQCPKCAEEFNQSLVTEKLVMSGVPEKVAHATFDNFEVDTPAKKKALDKTLGALKRNVAFIILRGSFGTGKSHLAAAILKKKGGRMVTEADLIGALRTSYSDNTSVDELVAKYRDVPVFVLDELTLEVKGVDIPALLYRILGYRHDRGLTTVITSNETLSDIMTILGPRITDRVRESHVVVTMEWDSHRKAK